MSRVSDYLEPLRALFYSKGRQQAIEFLCHRLHLTTKDADNCITHLLEDGLLVSPRVEKPYRVRRPRKVRRNAQETDDSSDGVIINLGSL